MSALMRSALFHDKIQLGSYLNSSFIFKLINLQTAFSILFRYTFVKKAPCQEMPKQATIQFNIRDYLLYF